MNTRRIVTIIGIWLIYNLLIFYIGWNGWVWLETVFNLQQPWLYSIMVGVVGYSYLLGRIHDSFSLLKVIGSSWFAILQYALIIIPLANILVLVLSLFGVPLSTSIYWTGLLVILIFILIFMYGLYQAYSPVVRKYEIQIPKQANKHQTLRIAMASDMHFGQLSGVAHLRRLVDLVNRIQPDLVLFPGDIVDDDPGLFIKKGMGQVMREIKAPLGMYGVLGNHEYYGGKIAQFVEVMKQSGVRILLDETICIDDSFYLIGRKDRTDRNRKSIQELLEDVDQVRPIMLMDHQPYELEQAMEQGVDLSLSGHTHRGQMAPNHLITQKIYELDWGYKQKNQLHAIVSSGFGFWGPPIRIGSRSEIVQIDITFLGNGETE